MHVISHIRVIRITLARAEQGHPRRYRRPQRCRYNSANQTAYIYRYSTNLELQIHLSSPKPPSSSPRTRHPKPSTSAGSQRRYRCSKHRLLQTGPPEKLPGDCRHGQFSNMMPLCGGGLQNSSLPRSRGPSHLLGSNSYKDQCQLRMYRNIVRFSSPSYTHLKIDQFY